MMQEVATVLLLALALACVAFAVGFCLALLIDGE